MANGHEVKVFEWRFGPASVLGLIQLGVLVYGLWWFGSFLKKNFDVFHETVGVVKELSQQVHAHEQRLLHLEAASLPDSPDVTRR